MENKGENLMLGDCLKYILKGRGIFTPTEIISDFIKGMGKTGGDVALKLSNFTEIYGLGCEYHSPYVTYETDIILRDGLNNEKSKSVLVAYNQKIASDGIISLEKMFSVVESFRTLPEKVDLLVLPGMTNISLGIRKLNDSIRIDDDSRFGFYVIGENKK